MLLDLGDLRRHRQALREDDDGWFLWGNLEALWTHGHINRQPCQENLPPTWQLRAILNVRGDLYTTLGKVEWLLQQRDHGILDPLGFSAFAASDIVSFFTQVRSLFDYWADAIRLSALQPDQVRQGSFQRLQNWLEDEHHRQLLGSRTGDLVADCQWFADIRNIRDGLIHRNVDVIVFPEEPGITFDVFAGAERLIDEPALRVSDTVASFERVAAATMARLYAFTEDVAHELVKRYEVPEELLVDGWVKGPGLDVAAGWTDLLMGELE